MIKNDYGNECSYIPKIKIRNSEKFNILTQAISFKIKRGDFTFFCFKERFKWYVNFYENSNSVFVYSINKKFKIEKYDLSIIKGFNFPSVFHALEFIEKIDLTILKEKIK